MKSTIRIRQAMLLMMISHLASSMEDQSLICYNDYIENLTCEWNSSALESSLQIIPANCFLNAICYDYITYQNVRSLLRPLDSQSELLTATIVFKEKCLLEGDLTLQIFVRCGDTTVEEITKFDLSSNVKLNPPENLQVDGANVSWTRGSPQSENVFEVKYQLQYKPVGLSWERVKLSDVSSTNCLLPEHELIQGEEYEVRVRSDSIHSSKFWSDWSPTTRWTSTVGKTQKTNQHEFQSPHDMMLWLTPGLTSTVVIIVVVLILLAACRFHPITCSLKSPDMRNPFDELYDHHNGDFKSWVGAFVGPESFFNASKENFSPVEICKAQNLCISQKMDEDKKKSFSNSTYFLSQSSKCTVNDQLEPCPEHCPYGPTGGGSVEEKALMATEFTHNSDTENDSSVSGPLEMSSSYKHLQKLRLDVQSLDSGFAAGSDQDSQEESGSEGLPSPPVVDNVLPCPIPQLPHVSSFPHRQFPSTPVLAWCNQNSHLLQILPSSICTNIFMGSPDDIDFSSMVEPASEDYMPVRMVQE